MIVRLKDGVSLDKCHPKIFFAIMLASQCWQQFGAEELWISAGNEAGHTTNADIRRQFHRLPDGTCQAIDLRIHQFTNTNKSEARRILASMLGFNYDVLLENIGKDNEHIHVQWDPERPGTVL